MERLKDDERESLSTTVPEWTVDDEVLRRTFEFHTFVESMGFVTSVALLAEKANHHPDIDIRWNRVTLALTTHDADGLTDRDVQLAVLIDGLV
jgi:4a-hydroxytetrahydrobiopterin dehydratase